MRKLTLLLIMLMGTPACYAGQVAVCSGDGMSVSFNTDAQIADYADADFILSHPCPPTGVTTDGICLTQAQANTIAAIPSNYRKCIDNEPDGIWDEIVEWTQAEKDDQTATDEAESTLQTRTSAETTVDEFSIDGVVFRAAMLAILDQINALRSDIQAISEASIEIPDVTRPAFTPLQMKDAIKNKIQAGNAD